MIELSTLQRLPEWMHVRSPELHLVWATDLVRRTFDWPNHGSDPLPMNDADQLVDAAEQARQAGRWVGTIVRRDVEGHDRRIESRWSTLVDEKGALSGFFVLEYDLTDRLAEDDHLIRAQRMESIATLAGGVAHDINNVLGPIILGSEMIRRKVNDPWILQKLEGMEGSARRGADVVRQLLDFSRGMEGETIPIQIRHVMKELVDFVQHAFSKRITIEGSFPRDVPLVLGDAARIRQAVLNLMVNARDAIGTSGTVRIDMEERTLNREQAVVLSPEARPGSFVAISVRDTGSGIAEDIQDRIFEPFFSTRSRGQGSGLGLSTSLAIVKGHGGFMTVSSTPGEGSVFTVFLPQAESTSPSDEPIEGRDATEATTATHTILIVDDEPMMLEMNADMLASFGHQTMVARDGQAGLDCFLEDPTAVDLVITDINMPVMDGPTMIREMRKARPGLPIIAVSGLSQADHARDGTGLEGTEILHKPYSTDQLLAAIAAKMTASAPVDAGNESKATGTKEPDQAQQHTGDTLSDPDFDQLMGGDW